MTVRRQSRAQRIDLYGRIKKTAVIGASGDPAEVAHQISLYLHDQGYRILPVSPRGGELFGEPV